jgi:hypothetical protein
MPRRLYAFKDFESPFEDHVIYLGAKPLGRASPETGSPPRDPLAPRRIKHEGSQKGVPYYVRRFVTRGAHFWDLLQSHQPVAGQLYLLAGILFWDHES